MVVLLAGGLGAWFLIGSDDDDGDGTVAASSSSPSASISAPETVPGTGGFLGSPRDEEWGTVHFEYEIERDDDESLNVYFVAEGASDQEILKRAKECVKANLEGYFGVSCYGFETEEALQAANPSDQTGAMDFPCWRAFFSDSQEANEPGKGVAPEEPHPACV